MSTATSVPIWNITWIISDKTVKTRIDSVGPDRRIGRIVMSVAGRLPETSREILRYLYRVFTRVILRLENDISIDEVAQYPEYLAECYRAYPGPVPPPPVEFSPMGDKSKYYPDKLAKLPDWRLNTKTCMLEAYTYSNLVPMNFSGNTHIMVFLDLLCKFCNDVFGIATDHPLLELAHLLTMPDYFMMCMSARPDQRQYVHKNKPDNNADTDIPFVTIEAEEHYLVLKVYGRLLAERWTHDPYSPSGKRRRIMASCT